MKQRRHISSYFLYTLSVSGLLLTGCATKAPDAAQSQKTNNPVVQSLGELAALQPATVGEAVEVGAKMVAAYVDGAGKLKKRRRLLNMGIWLANTYTAGAVGLNAHRDNLVVSTVVGQSFSSLDGIVNAGGPASYGKAISKTSCIMNAGRGAATADVIELWATLKAYRADYPKIVGPALDDYSKVKLTMMAGYVSAYGDYISSTTSPLISATTVPKANEAGTGTKEENKTEEDKKNQREEFYAGLGNIEKSNFDGTNKTDEEIQKEKEAKKEALKKELEEKAKLLKQALGVVNTHMKGC